MNILLFLTLMLCWASMVWAVWPLSLERLMVVLGSSSMIITILVFST